MGNLKHYVIRGGVKGHERLKVLSRVMHATSCVLFDRVGVVTGARCLDIGCGSGDITRELARRAGPNGAAVGADIDETKLQLARDETEKLGITNVEFRSIDIRERPETQEFDVVYARFLLTHLSDPGAAVDCFREFLKPGGVAIVEDIDFGGSFVHPPSKAFDRYHEIYCSAVSKRGGDPNIGPRLPLLLKDAGFQNVDVMVVQPMGLEGEVKLLGPLTMEAIVDAAIAEQLTTSEEAAEIITALYDYVADTSTLAGTPRIVQAWGRKK
jgi:SAM-dependent methyltransferase